MAFQLVGVVQNVFVLLLLDVVGERDEARIRSFGEVSVGVVEARRAVVRRVVVGFRESWQVGVVLVGGALPVWDFGLVEGFRRQVDAAYAVRCSVVGRHILNAYGDYVDACFRPKFGLLVHVGASYMFFLFELFGCAFVVYVAGAGVVEAFVVTVQGACCVVILCSDATRDVRPVVVFVVIMDVRFVVDGDDVQSRCRVVSVDVSVPIEVYLRVAVHVDFLSGFGWLANVRYF